MKNPITDNDLKKWALAAVIMLLEDDLDSLCNSNNQCGNAGGGSDNADNNSQTTQPKGESLAPVSPDKTAVVYFKPSFIGYLKAAWCLFKEAFRNKKPHNFVVIR